MVSFSRDLVGLFKVCRANSLRILSPLSRVLICQSWNACSAECSFLMHKNGDQSGASLASGCGTRDPSDEQSTYEAVKARIRIAREIMIVAPHPKNKI